MKILLFSTILYGLAPAESTELSAPSLPSGIWGRWQHCKDGSLARGFRVKVNFPWMSFLDTEGLTGIQLLCGSNSLPNFANAPTSSYRTQDSEWQGVKMCPEGSYITSFNLRQDRSDSWFHDNKGATNLKVRCSDGTILIGDGLENAGKYTAWLNCPPGLGICGLKTKVDEEESFFGGIGLVTTKMVCCRVPRGHARTLAEPKFSHHNKHTAHTSISETATTSNQSPNHTLIPFNNTTEKTIQKKPVTPTVELPKLLPATPNTTKTVAANIPNHRDALTSLNVSSKADTKKGTSTLHIISSYKDPYLNLPIALEIIVLIAASIFFFIAGFLFKKVYLVKFQEKHFQSKMKSKTGPPQLTDVKASK